MKTRLTKGIMLVLIANTLNMCFSILTNLVLPKNLSVETYAVIKTYQLYLSYVGILHFGFVDGIYLKFGGKDIKSLDWETVAVDLSSFRIFQFVISMLGILASIIIHDPVLGIASIMVLPTNMLNFFKYLFQACGEYSAYGRVINVVSFATFIVNIGLIGIFRSDNYMSYLVGYVFVNLAIWLVVERLFEKKISVVKSNDVKFSMSELIAGMKEGILLTLGNFTSILTTTMDRWFVKLFIGTGAFAQFAFAVSMENFLNAAITPVSITLYNSFCIDSGKTTVEKYRKCVAVFATGVVAAAFPIKFIIEIYLQKYTDSVSVIFLLFSAQMFYVIIKSIYVNLYKTRKRQKKYFSKLMLSLTAGFILNVLAYFIANVKEAYAIATVISAIFWFILVQIDFKEEKISIKELLYLMIEFIVFLFTGFNFNSVVGFCIYVGSILLFSFIFIRPTLFSLFEIARKFINRKVKHIS